MLWRSYAVKIFVNILMRSNSSQVSVIHICSSSTPRFSTPARAQRNKQPMRKKTNKQTRAKNWPDWKSQKRKENHRKEQNVSFFPPLDADHLILGPPSS